MFFGSFLNNYIAVYEVLLSQGNLGLSYKSYPHIYIGLKIWQMDTSDDDNKPYRIYLNSPER